MSRTFNLDKFSYADLLQLQQEVEEALAARKQAEAREVKEKAHAIAEAAGFSLDEILGIKRRGGGASIKYRNPKNLDETWTGRGRKPNWLSAALTKGAKLESFAVTSR